MRSRVPLLALALVLAPGISALQAQVIDQQNPLIAAGFGYWGQAWNSQTFRPSSNTVAGGGFNVDNDGGNDFTGTLQVELWSDIASNPGASMLASGSTVFTMLADSQGMVDAFWAPVSVSPGSQYFLTGFINDAGGNLISTWSNDTYGGVEAYYNYSTTVTDPQGCCGDFYDLTFEEYSTNGISSTPEPASLALVATGLVGLAGVTRRRRKPAA